MSLPSQPETRKEIASAPRPFPPPPPPDNAQRERILAELDRSLFVEASAGTGKTTSMVGRMIGLLREEKCSIETIAAVTFTRKAAAELRGRFQIELEQAARLGAGPARQRLAQALAHAERCFIGTIHSFCARLLRERPVEANVDIGFREIEPEEDRRLRQQAWEEYVARLFVTEDPILDEFQELGLDIGDLHEAFFCFADYPDVDVWPAPAVDLGDLKPVSQALKDYATHMGMLSPSFPDDPGNDKLMPLYDAIPLRVRQANLDRPAELMEILALFREVQVVQKNWPGGKAQGKAEKDRWEQFVNDTAQPKLRLWFARRYGPVVRILREGVKVYDRVRKEAGALNYQDLLLRAASLLRVHPEVRQYFRRRFTHLLVDEFQDTDPVQAQVMLLLTGSDPGEKHWSRCRPVPGSLFVVGDPKQSIFRFRRADIVTYEQVKKIVVESGGDIVSLTANFRTIPPLIDWVNQISVDLFPVKADAYAPAYCAMQPGRAPSSHGDLQGLQVIPVPQDHKKNDEVLAYEADLLARAIHHALTAGLTVPRASRELERGATPAATPGDFLIITRNKANLTLYGQKLQALGIPHQITGGSALRGVDELALLHSLLLALTEPDNPVALVAVLRGKLFGISDTSLYAFKRAGGKFSFHSPVPEALAACVRELLDDAFARLRRYDLWLKRFPPVAAFELIAGDLGLFAQAASVTGGNVQAGGLSKAFEVLRSRQAQWLSLADGVGDLGELLQQDKELENLPAWPHETPAVRIMNLHKVKGLEAPVVFLADPTGDWDHEIRLHVDRSAAEIRGYLALYGRQPQRGKAPLLAQPPDWERFAEEERQFQAAEIHRLLYVAATRAGVQLVITQRSAGSNYNFWRTFQSYLASCGPMPVPPVHEPIETKTVAVTPQQVARAAKAIDERWSQAASPTYATEAAKAYSITPVTPVTAGSPGFSPGEHGTEWGTVLHGLLEARMLRPDANLLALAYASLLEHGLDPAQAGKAVEMVETVTASDLWRRALSSQRRLVEVPFQTLLPAQTPAADSKPTILRGVIDLAFQESEGWVIVDYKTDRAAGNLNSLIEHYRPQVTLYAKVWSEVFHQRVIECGLYFLDGNRYEKLAAISHKL